MYVFDEYKDDQRIAYNLLKNSLEIGKLSHAYLIDTNNYEYSWEFVLSFVKMVICPNHYSNFSKCGSCSICSRILDGNYMDFKIIEPEQVSLVIKKEQILDIQVEFSKKSIEGKNLVYVIKDCDCMNAQAANCLLKFLEEPNEKIIAILVTNNVSKVLNTVVSRCQLVRLYSNSKNELKAFDKFLINICDTDDSKKKFLDDPLKVNMIENIVNFICYLEEFGIDVYIYIKKFLYDNFNDRNDYILGMYLIINFYYDVLKSINNIDDFFFSDYIDEIKKISDFNNNSSEKILNKLNVFLESSNALYKNCNIFLTLDYMLIKFKKCM